MMKFKLLLLLLLLQLFFGAEGDQQQQQLINPRKDFDVQKDLATSLFETVEQEDLEEATRLLATGSKRGEIADVSLALNLAAERGFVDFVELFLEFDIHHVDELRNGDGWTPLISAARGNSVSVMELLLQDHGAGVNATTDAGETALHWAAIPGHLEAVELLLRSDVDYNVRNQDNYTALHFAAVWGHEEVLRALVQVRGLDVDAKDNKGQTALFITTENGNLRAAQTLVRLGRADTSIPAETQLGYTVTHWAAFTGRTDLLRLFIEEGGADINVPNPNGETPLFLAAAYNRPEALEYLISHKAKVDQRGTFMISPLMYAAHDGHDNIVQRLLQEEEVDPNVRSDMTGWTPLIWSANEGHLEVVKLLLKSKKTEVDLRDEKNRTALHFAAWRGGLPTVQALLLEGGASVAARDSHGRIPLHYAAMGSQVNTSRWLLEEAGSDPTSEDEEGFRPADLAAERTEGQEGAAFVQYLMDQEQEREGKGREELLERKGKILYKATLGGNFPVVNLILKDPDVKASAPVEILLPSSSGGAPRFSTSLHAAASRGSLELVIRILRLAPGDGKEAARSVDSEGRTPVDMAERAGARGRSVVRYLRWFLSAA